MSYFKPILLIYLLAICPVVALAQQPVIPLYAENNVPFAKPGGDIPRLTVFAPEKPKKNGIAVVVCSGGSYGGRANNVEGIPACKKLMAAGITAFLLDYRIPKAEKMDRKEVVPLTDGQRAIQYVREHAKQYKVDTNKVGIMGFSAGGHLVSTLGTHFTTTELANPAHTSLRPDFMVLIYPVISFADSLTHKQSRQNLIGPDLSPERIRYYSNELQVTDSTPPTYITHGIDDKVVSVANSLYFEAALKQHHVPVQMFLYERGAHGYGVNNKLAQVQWIDDCIEWIQTSALVKRK
jgi:acetyl esterase/lipase